MTNDSPSTLSLSVVIPMMNEEENVETTVREVYDTLVPTGWELEVIIVDDGSTDDTFRVAQELAAKHPWLRVERHLRNMGRGRAMRTGFAAARGDVVCTIDADLSYHPRYIVDLVNALLQDPTAAVAVGSPYMPGGGTQNVPLLRLWVSRIGNIIAGAALPGNVRTVTGIFRAYRREVLETLELESDGKEIHLEILVKAISVGYRVVEVPAVLRGRVRGYSKFRFGKTAATHLAFSLFERPIFLFGLIGMVMLILGLIAGLYVTYLRYTGNLTAGRPLMTLVALLVIGGLQMVSFGFIGTQIVALRKEIFKVQQENLRLQRALESLTSGGGNPGGESEKN